MIIKSITIENFRSYYGNNHIELGEGLTLIIGSNGDGKTTLFEALEWLFRTRRYIDELNKLGRVGGSYAMDEKFISKKKIVELETGKSACVKVSMTYINREDCICTTEKSFRFTKNQDDSVSLYDFAHQFYVQQGVENTLVGEGEYAQKLFDRDFATSIRLYCMFKGEQDLNIFKSPEAMKSLIETFSNIKDFDPYLTFVESAEEKARRAHENALKADKTNKKEIERLDAILRNEDKKIGELEAAIRSKESEVTNFSNKLEELERNKESSELLVATNNRIQTLNDQLGELYKEIKENYTFRLLDEMWILMGFEPIAEEFRELVGTLDKEQRRMECEFQRELGAKKMAAKMQEDINQGFIPLALNIPDENTMREMLHDKVCKVCGTPAPEGSKAYNTMKKHLQDYLDSLKQTHDEEEIETLFKRDFIKELNSRYNILHNNMGFIKKLPSYIESAISYNRVLHQKVDTVMANIEHEEDIKKKILAQANGLTEEQLVSAYNNINEWWKSKSEANSDKTKLEKQLEEHKEKRDQAQKDFDQISRESTASAYGRTYTAIRKISEAFKAAKIKNKMEFIANLENVANQYLGVLNKGDFKGKVRILGTGELTDLALIDVDGSPISNPNTALKTTMYMSVLFAVANLSTLKKEQDFPLIFDAPTSSFTAAKESDFFEVIGEVKKQTIIVTKSFLLDGKNGESILDMKRIQNVKGKKYRIEKLRPFDDKNLATIQTTITSLS